MRDLSILFAGPSFARLGRALLLFLWQGTAVAVLLAASRLALAREGPRLRYAAACGALCLMVLLPILTFVGHSEGTPPPGSVPFPTTPAATKASLWKPAPTVSSALGSVAGRLPLLQPWLIAAWMAGVAGLSLRYLTGWSAAQRLRRRDVRPARAELEASLQRLAARLGVRTPVRLLESAAVTVPMAMGALKPVILFPVSALSGLSPTQVETILAHELAHIPQARLPRQSAPVRRRDPALLPSGRLVGLGSDSGRTGKLLR